MPLTSKQNYGIHPSANLVGDEILPRSRRTVGKKTSPDDNSQTKSNTMDQLVKFWYADPSLPPLYGTLRLAFYMSILLILLTEPGGAGSKAFKASSCRRALRRFDTYDHFGFDVKFEAGFFGHGLRYFHLDPQKIFNCYWLQQSVRYGLGLSAVGFGGKLSRIVAAVSFWTMFGIKMASFGPSVGHEQYLCGVAMIAFCFAENNLINGWSVDSVICNMWAKMNGRSSHSRTEHAVAWDGTSPSPGRAARKIVLIQACLVMFFAGLHKFASYGLQWWDGGTIALSLHPGNNARIEPARDFVMQHMPIFLPPMASVSVIWELASIFAVFSQRWRPICIFGWVAFHSGIMALMHPNFAMNMSTYLVLIDWRGLFKSTSLLKVLPFLAENNAFRVKDKDKNKEIKSESLVYYHRGTKLYTFLALVMFVTSILRIDYWPISSYALYNWHPSDPGPGFNDAKFTPEEAIASANRCLSQPPIGPTCANKSGSNHHDSFVSVRRDYIQKVVITGIDDVHHVQDYDDYDDDNNVSSDAAPNCSDNELRVYINFIPHSCISRPKDGSKVTGAFLRETMREVLTKRKAMKKLPEEFGWQEYVEKGLKWRVDDHIVASLVDEPRCFAPAGTHNKNERDYLAEPSPDSIASDMARRLRHGLTKHRYLPDRVEEVLGVGFFWEFVNGGTGERNSRGRIEGGSLEYCKLGESIVGESIGTEVGEPGKKFRELIRSHERYWDDVLKGIVLAAALLGGAALVWPKEGEKKRHSKKYK